MITLKKILEKYNERFPISIDYPPITEMEVFTQMEIDARHKRALLKHQENIDFITSTYKSIIQAEMERLKAKVKYNSLVGWYTTGEPVESKTVAEIANGMEKKGYNNCLEDQINYLKDKLNEIE